MIPGTSAHFMVALHALLELLHYGVWIIAIPVVALRTPWRLDRLPLATRSRRWRVACYAVLALGIVAVVALWLAFAVDYTRTRDLYFAIAIVHVLAEAPLLIRML